MWNGQVFSIDELDRRMKESMSNLQGDDEEPVCVMEVSGSFTESAVREWCNLLLKHGEKMFKYAVAISMMRGDTKITEAHIRKAFELVSSGMDQEVKDINNVNIN